MILAIRLPMLKFLALCSVLQVKVKVTFTFYVEVNEIAKSKELQHGKRNLDLDPCGLDTWACGTPETTTSDSVRGGPVHVLKQHEENNTGWLLSLSTDTQTGACT